MKGTNKQTSKQTECANRNWATMISWWFFKNQGFFEKEKICFSKNFADVNGDYFFCMWTLLSERLKFIEMGTYVLSNSNRQKWQFVAIQNTYETHTHTNWLGSLCSGVSFSCFLHALTAFSAIWKICRHFLAQWLKERWKCNFVKWLWLKGWQSGKMF